MREKLSSTYIAHPLRSNALKPHLALALGSLHPVCNINSSMQLVHCATDPGDLAREVDLIAQDLARLRRHPQSIEGTADDARRRFLVVENTEHGGANDDREDRQGPLPAATGIHLRQCTIRPAVQQRTRIRAGSGDQCTPRRGKDMSASPAGQSRADVSL